MKDDLAAPLDDDDQVLAAPLEARDHAARQNLDRG
jgi:hypothetical protein